MDWRCLLTMRWLGLGFEAGLGVLAWLLGWWLGIDPLATCYWSLSALGIGLLACVPMLGIFAFCLWCPLPPFVKLRHMVDEWVVPIFDGLTTLDFLLLSCAAGLGEEMLFRGLIQAGLAQQLGVAAGLVLASLLFGVMHAITVTYAAMAALLGLYLGGVWLYSENLLSVIVAHAVYDFLALLLLVRNNAE